jgi:hypothetical protein
MIIRYSSHALVRRGQRTIPKEEIERAITLGIKSVAQGGARMTTHKTKTKSLVVIYQIISVREIKVITAYYQQP